MIYVWVSASPASKLILTVMAGLVFVSAVRFARLAFRLYPWLRRRRFAAQDIVETRADWDLVAALALRNGALCNEVLLKRMDDEFRRTTLGMAECRFEYLWESCMADAESGKRAGVLLLLLSVPMVGSAYSARLISFAKVRVVTDAR